MNISKKYKKEKLQRNIPIIIVLLYLTITVALFSFGPYNYPLATPIYFYGFVFFAHLMLFWGYMSGKKVKKRLFLEESKVIKFLKIAIVVQLVFIPLTNYLNTGSMFFNLSSIKDLGSAYSQSIALRQGRSLVTIISYFRILFSPFLIAYLPLGVFYFKKLNTRWKAFLIIAILGGLGLDLFRGTNRMLANYIIVFMVLFLVKAIYKSRIMKPSIINQSKLKNVNITFNGKLIFVFILLFILLIGFYNFFSASAPKRFGVSLQGPNHQYVLDLEHPLLRLFSPLEVKLAIGLFIHYFTQGYYALGLALEKPFLPTFGLGSSMAVLLNITNLFNTNLLFERTYVYRNYIIDGWDWHMQWSSFYVWVASDISFIGVVFLMFLIGYFLAKSWIRTITLEDPISLIVFTQLMILCFYIPANNQLFQGFEGLFGNLFWLFYWLLKINGKKVVLKR